MDALLFESTYNEDIYRFNCPTTVIVDKPWNEIGLTEKELLSKILAAVRLTMDAVSIKYQSKFDLSNCLQKPKHVISFCNVPEGIPLYEPIMANDISIVAADSLTNL